MKPKGWPEGHVYAAGDELDKDPPVVEIEDDEDPDDEELDETPADVVMLLGFDPKEFSESDPTENFDPDQPRDEDGKWTDGGGSGGSSGQEKSEGKKAGGYTGETSFRASAILSKMEDTRTPLGKFCDMQMRGGVLNDKGEFKDFSPATKNANLNRIGKELDNLKGEDPEAFELARRESLAQTFGVNSYEKIPDEVRVWRGHDEGESFGKTMNVTNDPKIASEFGKYGVVTEFSVRKDDIIFSLSNSVFDEGELIVPRKALKEVGRKESNMVRQRRELDTWAKSATEGMKIRMKDGREGTLRGIGVTGSLIVAFGDETNYRVDFEDVAR